jgi:hypothetical protein
MPVGRADRALADGTVAHLLAWETHEQGSPRGYNLAVDSPSAAWMFAARDRGYW